jgi:heat shock protein HslJ
VRSKRLLCAGIALLVLIAFIFSGCFLDSVGTETLKGTKWLLTAASVSSLDLSAYSITADFDELDISGRSAVNTYGGPYTITGGGGFKVGDLSSTLMGGSEEAMRAEALYFELLQQARKYSVTKTTLTLMDEGNQELLIFQAR